MTTDLITFFHPDGSTGKDWTFSLQLGNGETTEFWVFDRGGNADFSSFSARKVSSDKEIDRVANEVRTLIQESGGFYSYALDHNGVLRCRLVPIEAPGYAPPKQVLRLSPAAAARFEDITGKADLAVGDHLVVPISATAEKRLGDFCRDLDGFPADLKALVLNVIRRPSLEWRIHRIERTLKNLPPATQAEQQREQGRSGKFLNRLRRAIMRPIPLGPAIAAMLLLAGGTLFASHKLSSAKEEGNDPAPTSATPSPENQSDKDPQSSPQSPSAEAGEKADALKDLFEALKGSDDRSPLKKLYNSHFQGHDQAPFNGSSPVVWGIAKLEAAQLGFLPMNNSLFGPPLDQAGVKKIYTQKGTAALKNHKESKDLLVWSFCKAFGKPELNDKADDPKPLALDKNIDCGNLESTMAEPGLKDLTDWVKKSNQTTK